MASQTRRGFTLRLFLPEGLPEGLQIVEKSNWTGQGIVCPRARFKYAKVRSEFDRTGVYILVGPSEESDLPTVYIGEGDPALDRLERHSAEKDFWTSLVLFVSKDKNLNKAHVQYLEVKLIELARQANRCVLDNVQVPQAPSLSESDIAEMDAFLDEMLLIYPLLGLTVFDKPKPATMEAKRLFLKGRGIEAEGYEDSNGFVVVAGSQVAKDCVPSAHRYLITLRSSLQDRGVISMNEDRLMVTQNYSFDSPSTAAGVLLGRSSNGRVEWRDIDGRTLKDIQTSAVLTESVD